MKSKGLFALLLMIAGCGVDSKIIDILDPPGPGITPVAVISAKEVSKIKTSIMLNGAGSYDPKSESLIYQWTLAERPFGSVAAVSTSTSAVTTFFADKGGYYTVSLSVTNASGVISLAALKRISIVGTGDNHPPVAIAKATPGTGVIVLDATSSYDVDEDEITYEWVVVTAPEGSKTSLTSKIEPITYLYSNIASTITVRLHVTDGVDQDDIVISATLASPGGNVTPVAIITVAGAFRPDNQITLNGLESWDPKDQALRYQWSLVELPFLSVARLTNSFTGVTTFVADQAGYYTVLLTVTNASGIASRLTSRRILIIE